MPGLKFITAMVPEIFKTQRFGKCVNCPLSQIWLHNINNNSFEVTILSVPNMN